MLNKILGRLQAEGFDYVEDDFGRIYIVGNDGCDLPEDLYIAYDIDGVLEVALKSKKLFNEREFDKFIVVDSHTDLNEYFNNKGE